MIEHSYRSYLFARALGAVEGIECDEEALFATTMFHDYAFPEIGSLTDRCFAVAGAEDAERFLESSPLSEDQRHDVLDAICLHINPSVSREQGALQHLAHDGIALDVVGMRAWELDGAGTRRVFEQPSPARVQRARRHGDEAARPSGPGLSHPVDVPGRVRAGAEAEPVGVVRKGRAWPGRLYSPRRWT